MLNGFDLIVVLFTAFLVVKGIWKGFVKEIAGIAAVILGIFFAFLYHDRAAEFLGEHFNNEYLSIASYALLFIATYIVVMTAGKLLEKVLKSLFLGGINKILGGVFGLIKSILWISLFVYGYVSLKSTVDFTHPSWILESALFPFFVDVTDLATNLF